MGLERPSEPFRVVEESEEFVKRVVQRRHPTACAVTLGRVPAVDQLKIIGQLGNTFDKTLIEILDSTQVTDVAYNRPEDEGLLHEIRVERADNPHRNRLFRFALLTLVSARALARASESSDSETDNTTHVGHRERPLLCGRTRGNLSMTL